MASNTVKGISLTIGCSSQKVNSPYLFAQSLQDGAKIEPNISLLRFIDLVMNFLIEMLLKDCEQYSTV